LPGWVRSDMTLRVVTCVEILESWLFVTHASNILPTKSRAHRYACTHAMVEEGEFVQGIIERDLWDLWCYPLFDG
jgi:hypothetical protein